MIDPKLDKYVISVDKSIRDAIGVISQNLCRCVIVTRDANIVVGVVSEGDVIRSLVKDVSLYAPLRTVVQPSFRYFTHVDMVAALELVKDYGITLIPVVDDNFVLIDVITIHDVISERSDNKITD